MRWFCSLFLILFFSSCGGGTSGTSSTSGGDLDIRTIRGTVVELQGLPVAGAIVRVSGGSEQATTDSQGQFELRVASEASLVLEIEDQGQVFQLEVDDADPSATVINVDAQLDRASNTASSMSVNSSIAVSGVCESYSTTSGDSVQITIPDGARSCDFVYSFSGSSSLNLESLDIASTSCTGLRASIQGEQLSGSVLKVFQGMAINKITRSCEAKVRATLQGFKTAAYFTVRYIASKGNGSNIDGTYRGALSLVRGSSPKGDCPRFSDSRLQLNVQVSGNNVSAKIPAEGLEFSQALGRGEDLLLVLQGGEGVQEEVRLRPMGGLGTARANFDLTYFYYVAGDQPQQCLRFYSGQLDKVR